MAGTKSYENYVAECDNSGIDVDDDIIELVELDKYFVLIHHYGIDLFLVSVFVKAVNFSSGDFEGIPRIETDDYDTAFNKFLATIIELK